jgi:serine/threonine protein kinase
MELPPRCRQKFAPIRLLAQGGFGSVLLANQVDLKRQVVVKLLENRADRSPEDIQRFRAEAQVTARLNHPGIVRLMDADVEPEGPWIAYEYIDGPTLARLIANRALPAAEVCELGHQVAGALQEAHACGIFHRDIKPANIIRTPLGSYKVIDFGVAFWLNTQAVRTAEGVLFGTPEYMPPEYIRGQPFAAHSDIYSLGIVLYHALTGQLPFADTDPARMLQWHLKGSTLAPRRLVEGVPPALERIILRCTERDPESRYRDCSHLLADLEETRQLLSGSDRSTATRKERPLLPVPARRKPLAPLAIGAGALVFSFLLLASRAPSTAPEFAVTFQTADRALRIIQKHSPNFLHDYQVRVRDADGRDVGRVASRGDAPATIENLTSNSTYIVDIIHQARSIFQTRVKSPDWLRVWNLTCVPGPDAVLIGGMITGANSVQVRVLSPDGMTVRNAHARVEKDRFRVELEPLKPDTNYLVDITRDNAFGGLHHFPFRTTSSAPILALKQLAAPFDPKLELDAFGACMAIESINDLRVLQQIIRFGRSTPHIPPSLTDSLLSIVGLFHDPVVFEALIRDPAAALARETGLQRLMLANRLARGPHPHLKLDLSQLLTGVARPHIGEYLPNLVSPMGRRDIDQMDAIASLVGRGFAYVEVAHSLIRMDPVRTLNYCRSWLANPKSVTSPCLALAYYLLPFVCPDAEAELGQHRLGPQHAGIEELQLLALARSTGPKARVALQGRIRSGPKRRLKVWCAAIRGLNEELLALTRLTADPSLQLRLDSMAALGFLGSRTPAISERIRRWITTRPRHDARVAAWMAGQLGLVELGPLIAGQLLPRDPAPPVLWAAGALRARAAIPVLRSLVDSLNPTSVVENGRLALAVWALAQFQDPADQPRLSRLLTRPGISDLVTLQASLAVGSTSLAPNERQFFLFPFLYFYPTNIRLWPEQPVSYRVYGRCLFGAGHPDKLEFVPGPAVWVGPHARLLGLHTETVTPVVEPLLEARGSLVFSWLAPLNPVLLTSGVGSGEGAVAVVVSNLPPGN